MFGRKRHVGEDILFRVGEQFSGFGSAAFQRFDHLAHLLSSGFSLRLGKDGTDRSGDHRFVALRNVSKQVPQTMDPTPLPAHSLKDRPNRRLQSGMRVGDHQLDAV